MVSLKSVLALAALVCICNADQSAVEVVQDIFYGCVQDLSVSCVKPKSLRWIDEVSDKPVIKITEDLVIVKKDAPEPEQQRGMSDDILDKFEDFIQSHELVARVPQILRNDGPLGSLLPRSFQAEDLKVPLAVTGRSKLVKKVIVPFLLGLKFKTAVLVPLALALIALKTWKALTLGLLSMVLTGALLIFKFTKPKVVNYEVIHYPHHHHDHHIEHIPQTGWAEPPTYGRQFSAQEMAYNLSAIRTVKIMRYFGAFVVLVAVVAAAKASPAKQQQWEDLFPQINMEEMRSMCDGDDPISCLKLKAISFLNNIFQLDNYKLSDSVEINKNSYRSNDISARSEASVGDKIENYIKSHDVTFKFPALDSEVTVDARNLDSDSLDVKLRFNSGTEVVEARKSKLKKILFPILTFVLLKAITLVPLALGVLGLKAWNALQLSFFSFIVSVGLAVFQLCKKIAADNAPPQIAAHAPWEPTSYAARSFNEDAQNIAYSAYVQ
ncbi:uncharacterized protein LOC123314128 [Coccinella septempunctata]|uniref:uncharacterized protein LOC123314128 n=1 Tax=Coccinella septempunctata TaxID=41139 RepID=UPI001D065A22|nr:uncharacterized protein LOC123314128 [Coccinella septempunctata]